MVGFKSCPYNSIQMCLDSMLYKMASRTAILVACTKSFFPKARTLLNSVYQICSPAPLLLETHNRTNKLTVV